jgi:hypothetical protein
MIESPMVTTTGDCATEVGARAAVADDGGGGVAVAAA